MIPTSGIEDLEKLVKSADEALYASKEGNRNRVTVTDLDDPNPTQSIERPDLQLAS